jgi:hypothetical protein
VAEIEKVVYQRGSQLKSPIRILGGGNFVDFCDLGRLFSYVIVLLFFFGMVVHGMSPVGLVDLPQMYQGLD